MSTRKTTFFYAMLIAVASLAVGMVIASRLDLTPLLGPDDRGAADEQRADHRADRRADLPQHREVAVADGRQHQDRDESEGTGSHDFFGGGGGSSPTTSSAASSADRAGRREDQAGRRGQRRQRPAPAENPPAAGTGFIINAKDELHPDQ